MVIQPASISTPAQAYPPQPLSRHARKQQELDAETAAAFAAADEEMGLDSTMAWARPRSHPHVPAGTTSDMVALQTKIAELEAEQARLRQAEHLAREEARAKQGEIAIVRSNQEKITKQYEARISVMQSLHADEAAKAKAELEAQRKEREKMETDNRFLQHDLAQEAGRVKKLHGPPRTMSTQRETPRKSKRVGRGDGFDHHEVRLASPSRSRDKSRGDQTPKAGAKRKRPANDSPVAALSFTQPPRQDSTEHSAQPLPSTAPESAAVKVDSAYEFVQRIINHSPYEGHERTVEAMAKYSFPSKSGKTLSSIFIRDISYPAASEHVSLPLRTCRSLLGLWTKCLQDRFFAPLYLILDMITSTLTCERCAVKAQLIEQALPICSQSIDLIAVPIARASKFRQFAAELDHKALDALAEEIDVERILDFLHDLCAAASLIPDRNETFWREMELTFVLQMLNKAQPIAQITTTLRMLTKSVRETTFACIATDPTKQVQNEQATVDRLTNLLFEAPEPPKDEPPYLEEEILELRLEVLHVLRHLSSTDHGGVLLVQQRNAIGRLVRFLDIQVSRLYRSRPTYAHPPPSSSPKHPAAHDLLVRSINLCVRILYHLMRTYSDTFEVVPKLHAVHGGYHKFLVSLTRVAFSEQMVFEAGIEDEVAEAAHGILDNVLGPEDGEAIMSAIETPRGTKGRGDLVGVEIGSGEDLEMGDG
jgi:hypothetical protein